MKLKTNYKEYYIPEEQVRLRNHELDKAILVAIDSKVHTILDVGAGAGVLASKLKNMGKEVICLDIKPENVDFMLSMGLTAMMGNVKDLDGFKDKSFDLVICQEVLEHLENPGEGLKELCRVGKQVIFTLPKMHPDDWHLWFVDWKEHANCIIIKLIDRREDG